jgi:hypothetical protein
MSLRRGRRRREKFRGWREGFLGLSPSCSSPRRRQGGERAAVGWKGGGSEVEGQATTLWRAGGGGVGGRRRWGGKRRRAWGRCDGRAAAAVSLGAASSGATTGVNLGGDVGGGEHRSHFNGLGIAFALRCWRSYGMGITVVVCKCFIGWVLLLEIVLPALD